MIEDTETLRRLQKTQLYLLLEVERICKKHNINYFLIGGTLLGAVRNSGFIPWDDDIDIGMLRSHYNHFISVCHSELSDEFFLQTKDTKKYTSVATAKLCLNQTTQTDSSEKDSCSHGGIYIDILPYDNITNDLRSKIQYNLCLMLRGIAIKKYKYTILNTTDSLKKRLGVKICAIVEPFLSESRLSQIMDFVMTKYNSTDTGYIMCLAGACYSYNQEVQEKEVISNYTNMIFEGYPFPVPQNYDKFLKTLYGDDYLTPPPENKRRRHSILTVDFGKYYEIDIFLKEKGREVYGKIPDSCVYSDE